MITAAVPRARVVLLGTIGDLHAGSTRYDLACLQRAVETLEPDLLGVEVEPGDWENGHLSSAPIEVRGALVPAARRMDTVIIPLGRAVHRVGADPRTSRRAPRALALGSIDAALARLQRSADGPGAVDAPLFRNACHVLCLLEEATAGKAMRREWERSDRQVLGRVLEAVRRDPGRLFVVAVRCRRLRRLRSWLRAAADGIELVDYGRLRAARERPAA